MIRPILTVLGLVVVALLVTNEIEKEDKPELDADGLLKKIRAFIEEKFDGELREKISFYDFTGGCSNHKGHTIRTLKRTHNKMYGRNSRYYGRKFRGKLGSLQRNEWINLIIIRKTKRRSHRF